MMMTRIYLVVVRDGGDDDGDVHDGAGLAGPLNPPTTRPSSFGENKDELTRARPHVHTDAD